MGRWLTAFVLILAFASLGQAGETIGFVKTVTGSALVIDSGKAIPAKVGTPVKMGNTLRTGSGGSLGVTFKDNTVMSFGPDTELTVDEYFYAPGADKLKFSSSMSRGTLQVVSGVIAKLKPKAVTVKTPSAMIGCRGTRFLVKVDP
jgi:hypothetical protein